MRVMLLVLLGLGTALQADAAFAQRRELGVHQHGRGTLNIAIEGGRVTMELEAPAADIVGFEDAARTKKQKLAVEKAKGQLAAPLSVFVLPAGAGCKAGEAKIEIEGSADDRAKGTPSKDDHGHSEFRVQYALECASPAGLVSIDFAYFKLFPGAQALDVNVITSKGQTKFEVTRAKPRIDLAGMM